MNRLIALIALAAVLGLTGFVEARGRGRHAGIQGVVDEVSPRYFTITYNKAIVKVWVDNNTKFTSAKSPTTADVIKPGVKVEIQGGAMSPTEIQATGVEVLNSASKKKKKD